jgi:DNA-binding NarL/FixJ family response regulator
VSAKNGLVALQQLLRLKPAVAVLDMDMPRMGGLEIQRQLTAEGGMTRFVILTLDRVWDLLATALDLGIRGYVLKQTAPTDLVDAIPKVQRVSSFSKQATHSGLRRPSAVFCGVCPTGYRARGR